jgi:multiple sugar transport system permease protein
MRATSANAGGRLPGSVRRARPLHLTMAAREAIAGYLFIAPWLLGFVIFIGAAMLVSLGISLLDTDLLTKFKWVGVDNFVKLADDELVTKALVNTAYYSFVMVPIGTVISLIVALMLNQNIKGQGIFRTLYYVPSIVSG